MAVMLYRHKMAEWEQTLQDKKKAKNGTTTQPSSDALSVAGPDEEREGHVPVQEGPSRTAGKGGGGMFAAVEELGSLSMSAAEDDLAAMRRNAGQAPRGGKRRATESGKRERPSKSTKRKE